MTVKVTIQNPFPGDKAVKVGILAKGDVSDVYLLEPGDAIDIEVGDKNGLMVEELSAEEQTALDNENKGAINLPDGISVDDVARACHEENRLYCQSLGDESQPAWDIAPAWQQDSALSGVLHVLRNPGMTPEGSHLSWLMQKSNEGWKYGMVKDAVEKTHPCMVDFKDLPEEHRKKDEIFIATVRKWQGVNHEHAGALAS